MNLRIPVTIPVTIPVVEIGNSFLKHSGPYINVDFDTVSYKPALFLSKDNILVNTLCEIYNEETNSNLEPIAIGGATYARSFNNCISFGANFPGDKDMCHQTDEFIEIENLVLACKIYARAIYELSCN